MIKILAKENMDTLKHIYRNEKKEDLPPKLLKTNVVNAVHNLVLEKGINLREWVRNHLLSHYIKTHADHHILSNVISEFRKEEVKEELVESVSHVELNTDCWNRMKTMIDEIITVYTTRMCRQ